MTEREALKQALVTIKAAQMCHPNVVMKLLSEAEEIMEVVLAQPEQICGFDVVLDESMPPDTFKLAQPEHEPIASCNGMPAYEGPLSKTQRTWEKPWVSLTDEETDHIIRQPHGGADPQEWVKNLASALEAKLKEKNT